jgi:hypothetical protein
MGIGGHECLQQHPKHGVATPGASAATIEGSKDSRRTVVQPCMLGSHMHCNHSRGCCGSHAHHVVCHQHPCTIWWYSCGVGLQLPHTATSTPSLHPATLLNHLHTCQHIAEQHKHATTLFLTAPHRLLLAAAHEASMKQATPIGLQQTCHSSAEHDTTQPPYKHGPQPRIWRLWRIPHQTTCRQQKQQPSALRVCKKHPYGCISRRQQGDPHCGGTRICLRVTPLIRNTLPTTETQCCCCCC